MLKNCHQNISKSECGTEEIHQLPQVQKRRMRDVSAPEGLEAAPLRWSVPRLTLCFGFPMRVPRAPDV